MNLKQTANERSALIRSIHLSPIASIITDPHGNDNPIIAANRQFEKLTGYSEAELIGQNCRILAGEETSAQAIDALRHAVATACPVVVELMNYRKDGSSFINAVMVAPLFSDTGELAYFVGSQMEVDQRRQVSVRAVALRRISDLTPRQKEVLRQMARGLRNRQIAENLNLTEKTIKMHRVTLCKRMGVATTGEAMRLAIEAGL